MSDINTALLEILSERIEDLEERVRLLEIGLDVDDANYPYDDVDDFELDEDPLD